MCECTDFSKQTGPKRRKSLPHRHTSIHGLLLGVKHTCAVVRVCSSRKLRSSSVFARNSSSNAFLLKRETKGVKRKKEREKRKKKKRRGEKGRDIEQSVKRQNHQSPPTA